MKAIIFAIFFLLSAVACKEKQDTTAQFNEKSIEYSTEVELTNLSLNSYIGTCKRQVGDSFSKDNDQSKCQVYRQKETGSPTRCFEEISCEPIEGN